MKRNKRIIVVIFVIASIVYGLWSISYAAVPHLINYQGRLTDASGTPLNGSYSITFRIYDAATAGNLLWQGTYSVSIQKGIFSVLLGDINDSGYNFANLAFDKPYYLEIKVGNEVMSPRQQITSAGYAIKAETAEVTEKIKADTSDTIPGYLSDKVDNSTIQVNSSDKLEVKGGLAQYIKGKGNNYKIDSGSVSVGAGSTAAITFTFTFAAAPIVVVSPTYPAHQHFATAVYSITTTGATVYCPADETTVVNWIAIGY